MRICLVSEHYPPRVGGIERHVAGLARQLADRGHEVCVITSSPGPDEVGGFRVHRFRVPLVPVVEIPFTPLRMLWFEDVLREEKVELVHCHHSVVSPAVASVAYYAQRKGIPTVITFHSLLDGYEPAFRFLDGVFDWSHWPVVFSAVSPGVAEGVQGVLKDREIRILPNGFDPDLWHSFRDPGGDTADVIVSTLRFAPRKRPVAMVRMAAMLREALPSDVDFRVRLIGDGPERRKVTRAVEALGVGDLLELTGELDHDALRDAYGKAHIFALPSVEESFGLAALEAMAAGLPVVARRGPGVAQFITHGENGFLADSDGEMVSHLRRLLTDTELRKRMSAPDTPMISALSWPRVMETHLAAYADAQRVALDRRDPA